MYLLFTIDGSEEHQHEQMVDRSALFFQMERVTGDRGYNVEAHGKQIVPRT